MTFPLVSLIVLGAVAFLVCCWLLITGGRDE
jgi:hypothetical protein